MPGVASHVLEQVADVFPPTTSVGAYKRTAWPAYQASPSGAPVGSADATASVASDGTLTFASGLADDTEYVAAAQLAGVWRTVQFSTGGGLGSAPDFGSFGDTQVPVWDEATREFKAKAQSALAVALASAADVTTADRLAGTAMLWDVVAGKFVFRDGAGVKDVTQPPYNCRGDAIIVTDGAISGGALTTLTSATAGFQTGGSPFTATDVGKAILIAGADTSSRMLHTTIAAVVNATTVTLTDAAAGAVAGARVVFGTNNAVGAQQAIDDCGGLGNVYFPAGTHASPSGRYVFDAAAANNLKIPTGALGLTVGGAVMGDKATTFELGERFCSGFIPNRGGVDDLTCQNVRIHHITFDANNVMFGRVSGSSATSHTGGSTVVFGTYLNGGWSSRGQRMNFANIVVEHCNTINVPSLMAGTRQNVSIVCTQLGSAEAVNTMTDVTVRHCNFQGGTYGVVVMGSGGGAHPQTTTTGTNNSGQATVNVAEVSGLVAGQTVSIGDYDNFEQHVIATAPGGTGAGAITLTTNLRFTQPAAATVIQANVVNVSQDRYVVEDLVHDTLLSDPSGYAGGAHVQLGGTGCLGHATISRVIGRGSPDTGIEADSGMTVIHRECRISDYASSGYLAKNFQLPELSSTGYRAQKYTYSKCVAQLGSQFVAHSGYGWCLNLKITEPTPQMGSVLIEGCKYRTGQSHFDNPLGMAIMAAAGNPVRRLIVRDFEATLENVSQNYASATGATLIRFVTRLTKAQIKLKDVHLSVNGTVTGGPSNLSPQWVVLTPDLAGSELYFEVDGLTVDGNLTGGPTNGQTNIINLGAGSAGSYHGSIRNFEYERWVSGDATPKAIRLGDGAATIKKRVTIHGDFANNPGGFDVSAASGLYPQIDVMPGTTWVNLPNVTQWPGAARVVTTPASGNAYRNVDLVPQWVIVNANGATITDLSIGRTNGSQHPSGTITYTSTGLIAGPIPLENGDYLKPTYSGGTPIFTVIPRRA